MFLFRYFFEAINKELFIYLYALMHYFYEFLCHKVHIIETPVSRSKPGWKTTGPTIPVAGIGNGILQTTL